MYWKAALLCLLLISMSFAVAAQGFAVLSPGAGQLGTLSDQTPLSLYSFSGSEGDLVVVRVIGLTPGMALNASLLSPSQQPLGSSMNDPFMGQTKAARLSALLPSTGTYSVLVGGTAGDYVVMLELRSAQSALPVVADTPMTVNLSPEVPSQTLSFNANPSSASSLIIQANATDVSLFASLFDGDGALSAIVYGLGNVCLDVPAGDGVYRLVIESGSETAFDLTITLQNAPCSGVSPVSGTTPPQEVVPPAPVATEEVSAPVTSSGGCTAQANGVVNIRSGPGTGYGVIGTLNPGQTISVVGTSGTGWYVVQSASIPQGWVSATVVGISGPCGNLPTVQAGETVPAPVSTEEVEQTSGTPTVTYTASPTLEPGQPTYTYTHTYTASPTLEPGQPTYTYTPTYTPTQTLQNNVAVTATYTPSYTPTATTQILPTNTPTPPIPVAPPDANYNLVIPLDSTASVTDFVSYPGGDTEDRAFWDVSGMNQNSSLSGGRARLILAVSCFGTGTQHITFFTGGQTYSCGQTIVDREITYDSRTGSVLITAVGGTNTYVQWVLTGTATRVN